MILKVPYHTVAERLVQTLSLLPACHMTTFFPIDGGAEREHFAVLSDQIILALS